MAQYDMTVQHEGGAREALGKRKSKHDMRPEMESASNENISRIARNFHTK
jgi:hypothetical protein